MLHVEGGDVPLTSTRPLLQRSDMPKPTNIAPRKPARGRSANKRAGGLDTDELILAGAERLFARYGYDAVSTKQLAAEAGLTIGALYHYFPSKDAVYAATIQRAFGTRPRFPTGIRDAITPAEQRLAQLAAWFVSITLADKSVGRLLQRELLDPRADTAGIIHTALFQDAFDLFQELLRELLPNVDLDDALASLLALLFGFSNLKGVRRLAPNVSDLLATPEEIGRHATELLLHGLGR